MTLRVGASFGPYHILPLEGRGGMAEVYRAHDTRLNRDVVLKVLRDHRALDASSVARLAREARLLAVLNHPNIAAIYGIEQHGGTQALVLELVEGLTLADRIAQGALPLHQSLGIARQVAAALDAAHVHGIVHRDVKPSNIKIRADGTVKVLDFGLATAVDSRTSAADHDASTLTAPLDNIAGTTGYMSPEQAQGLPVDRRTDIWAFGCVLFEMLTGHRPFEGANAAQTIAAILSQEPKWDRLPAAASASCRMVLRRCLQKDPGERMRDIGDVRLALDGAFDPGRGVKHDPALPALASLRAYTLPWLALVVAVVVTIAGLGTTRQAPVVTPLTFELHAPRGSGFFRFTMEPHPALSANGRRLAFIAEWQGRRALWVQTVGALDAAPVPGTEGATAPFWSPDGQFVGYFADERLKKVSLTGDRPVETLSDVTTRWGGTWAATGTIVFSGLDGLYRVAAEGGEAVRMTRLDESRGEFSHRWPVVVPDGSSRFAYLIRSTQEDARGIYLGSLDDPSSKRRLVGADSNGGFIVGPGRQVHLLFVRDSALLAQPFDPVDGRLTGHAVLIARPVAPGETGRRAPFSAASDTLVYRPSAPFTNRMVWMDRRGGRESYVGGASTEHRYPALSPDGTSLTFSEVDAETGRLDIWVVDLRRNTRERLTRDPVGALFPVWMPDGRSIVYASAKGGPFDLYRQSTSATADARALHRATMPGIKYPTDVTRDGGHLVFQSDTRMFRLSLAGDGQVSPLPRGIQGRVSPNGRWLAYTSTEAAVRQVYVTTFPEASERWRVSTSSGEDPQWRGDSGELFYIDGGDTLTAVPVLPGRDFRIGTARPLFRAAFAPRAMAVGTTYAASADGQRFLVLESTDDKEILLRVTTNWSPGQ